VNAREVRDELVRRAQFLLGVLQALLVAIAVAFWVIQIVRGPEYREQAENNRLRAQPIKAPRGLIYDRHGRILVENVPSYSLLLDAGRSGDVEASVAHAASLLGRPAEQLRVGLARFKGAPAYLPVALADNLSLSEVARFGVAGLEHPEFEVDVRHLRFYRHGRETAHVLGYLGEVSEEDLARAEGAYEPGDLVGRKGIEATYDGVLRGRDGQRVVVVDSRGKPLEEYGRHPAEPGQNLTLTLDLDLQQAADRLLADRVGVVVALDPQSGEILALASAPSYNPNLFSRRLTVEEWRDLLALPNQPLHNRALQSEYSPGSPFKIVMAVAGLSEGVVRPSDRVFCGGSAVLYNHRFRCWKRGGHGWVDLHNALKQSCDVYFYHLGQKLGVERIASYARRFGLGRPAGVDLKGEKGGLVPDSAWSLAVRRGPWYPGETISVAIGQGPLLATPLQMAAMLAAVANGGRAVVPHLVRGAAAPPAPIAVNPAALEAVRRGLWAVVNEPGGTGAAARIPELSVAGKTGTVQVISQKTWIRSEDLPPEHRDHAWFVSFAPFDDPQLVLVVFSEHGGKGSAEAAPIAKALYEQYFKAVPPADVVLVGG
jgi:penicillin-binding protein 2